MHHCEHCYLYLEIGTTAHFCCIIVRTMLWQLDRFNLGQIHDGTDDWFDQLLFWDTVGMGRSVKGMKMVVISFLIGSSTASQLIIFGPFQAKIIGNLYSKLMWKIQTHDLKNMSLLALPLDHDWHKLQRPQHCGVLISE